MLIYVMPKFNCLKFVIAVIFVELAVYCCHIAFKNKQPNELETTKHRTLPPRTMAVGSHSLPPAPLVVGHFDILLQKV